MKVITEFAPVNRVCCARNEVLLQTAWIGFIPFFVDH